MVWVGLKNLITPHTSNKRRAHNIIFSALLCCALFGRYSNRRRVCPRHRCSLIRASQATQAAAILAVEAEAEAVYARQHVRSGGKRSRTARIAVFGAKLRRALRGLGAAEREWIPGHGGSSSRRQLGSWLALYAGKRVEGLAIALQCGLLTQKQLTAQRVLFY